MIWHPHTDAPGSAENALIAKKDYFTEPTEPYIFLCCIAEVVDGVWVAEDTGRPITEPFWWADEAELVKLIPVAA